jgi:alpha-L-fucosidase 2
MPGVVELLPAMPQSFKSGAIDGVWLYTVAKLDHMAWNEAGIHATLTSNKAQTLTLRCRRAGCRFLMNGKAPLKQNDCVEYTFRKGETVSIEVVY